jgi:AcrR family transcriptional regulator
VKRRSVLHYIDSVAQNWRTLLRFWYARRRVSTAETPDKPLRKDAERNRQRILAAAGEVFAEAGLVASLDAVAERAGVGVGTVYRRFPDKEALIDALFEARIDEIVQIATECAQNDDPWAALTCFLDRAVTLHGSDKALKEIVFSTAHGHERVATARDRIKPLVANIVDRAKDAGALRDDFDITDTPVIQLMLTAVIEYAGDVAPDLWRRYLAIVLDGLRAEAQRTPLAPQALSDDQLDVVMSRGFGPSAR